MGSGNSLSKHIVINSPGYEKSISCILVLFIIEKDPLMAEWLDQVFKRHEMYCHDLEVMSSNPGQVQLGVHSTSVLNRT